MGTIWVKEFTGGLDSRRLPEAAAGGTLITGQDGHINRGGEFEKRAAFVPTYTLPSGTKNLAAALTGLTVFGDAPRPAVPSGILYQRLQHPDGATALSRVLSYDRYAGKLYVAAEFSDGSRYHFYDGVRVSAWYDGRAHASFTVAGATGNSLDTLLVNGVDIIGGAVNWTTDDAHTAALIAAAVNTSVSSPDYTATADGSTVNIVAVTPGVAGNNLAVTYTVTGLTVSPASGFKTAGGVDTTDAAAGTFSFEITGGTANVANQITVLLFNSVDVLGAAVTHTGDNTTTAAAVATQINNFTSAPDYTATSSGAVVTVKAVDAGATLNGQTPAPTVTGDFAVGNVQAMAGGVDARAVYVPGTFVKTIRSRVNSVSGPNAHGSGIKAPTQWTTDAVGAFFADLSTYAEESENLTSIGVYQGLVAYFAERTVQIWSIDSDPTNNAQKQVLSNTGTASPRSVTKFGDNDLFYLDESGVRSIRARDASNAAATTDLGTPVDTLITAKLRALTAADRLKVVGLINPVDKRFWLVFPDQIFVFTFYEGSKISAWSTYKPTYLVGGVVTPFTIDDVAVYQRRVYLRGGNRVFCYGGAPTGLATDATAAVARVPYLDGGTPTINKEWDGLDVACRGVWKIDAYMQPNEAGFAAFDTIGTVTDTTYNGPKVPINGTSTHISLQFTSQGDGDARLSSCAIRYVGDKEPAGA